MTEMSKPVVIITGSSGLIGSAVTEDLSADFTVVGMDMELSEGGSQPDDFVQCDLTDDDSVQTALANIRANHGPRIASVIHLAAYYDFAGEPSEMYDKLTVEGTRRLLRELQGFQVEQFVFSSTILVMEPADEEDEKITESSPLEDEPWDYPRSKIRTEHLLFNERGRIPIVILRIAGVYDEDTHAVPIAQHISRIYEEQFESYFYPGDKTHGQAFVHLDDLVECIRRVIQLRSRLPETDIFIVAEPDLMSYRELQNTIGELVHGEEWTTIWIPKFMAKAGAWAQENILGDETFIKPWMIDIADDNYPVAITHARNSLNWEPKHRLRNTLPKMVGKLKQDPREWYEINGLDPPDDLKVQQEEKGRSKEAFF